MTQRYHFYNLTTKDTDGCYIRSWPTYVIDFNLLDKNLQKKHFEESIQRMNEWNVKDIIMATDYDNEIYFHDGIIEYKGGVKRKEILSALEEYNNERINCIIKYLNKVDELSSFIREELKKEKCDLNNMEKLIKDNMNEYNFV